MKALVRFVNVRQLGKRALSVVLLLPLCACAFAQETWQKAFSSPNGKIEWKAEGASGKVQAFDITYRDGQGKVEVLKITSYGLLTKDGGGKGLSLQTVSEPRLLKEHYQMSIGKKSECSNEAHEIVYSFVDQLQRPMRMVVRIYDDGVAFKYELEGLQHTAITQDQTIYHIPEGTRRWIQKWTEPYEEFFPLSTTGKGEKEQHWGYPALIQAQQGNPKQSDVFALITEGGIERYNSASSLENDQNLEDYHVLMDENQQHYTGSWSSPWRIVMVGKLQDLVASTLVMDVSAPCRLKDTSWIKPGSVSWIYWAYNHGSNDYQIVKKYVDMARTLHLPYVLIDAEWDEMKNGGTIEDAIRYAHENGVKPLIWYNSSTAWIKAWGAPGPHERLNAPENREKEFAWLEKMGVAGVKIDFFAGDKQETMEYCIDLLECAARHHLLVNFHGATIPRGWQRTYPNLLSTEGVYGAEWYNNRPDLTNKAACHNATLPFTRGIVGSMDYTPCTFSDSQHPHITTNAHELALPVLYESALMHWADKPESYLAQPKEVQDFITNLPTTWDETRLLSGYPGEYVVMARRKGNVWYVAGINGKNEAQMVSLDGTFLNKASKKVLLFEDTGDAKKPWKITRRGMKSLPAKMKLYPRGGFVMVLRK